MSISRRRTINPVAGLPPEGSRVSHPIIPRQSTPGMRSTPRVSLIHSPPISSLPSRSATKPFDWKAVENGDPPPYGTPTRQSKTHRLSKLASNSTDIPDIRQKRKPQRVIRKPSWRERIISLPSQLLFDIQMLPETLPLPSSITIGWGLGGMTHVLHLCARVGHLRGQRDDEIGWSDMHEENSSWFTWTSVVTILLTGLSFLVASSYFTRVKIYRLHHHRSPGDKTPQLVNSPHAKFVQRKTVFKEPESPSPSQYAFVLFKRLLSAIWHFTLFLIGQDYVPSKTLTAESEGERIQELEVWAPNDLEKSFCCIYSPVHALLWAQWGFHNWISIFATMALLSLLLQFLINAYDTLIKDRAILSAEVMSEYDQKFVNPRLFPIRCDAETQTNEAETITEEDWM